MSISVSLMLRLRQRHVVLQKCKTSILDKEVIRVLSKVRTESKRTPRLYTVHAIFLKVQLMDKVIDYERFSVRSALKNTIHPHLQVLSAVSEEEGSLITKLATNVNLRVIRVTMKIQTMTVDDFARSSM